MFEVIDMKPKVGSEVRIDRESFLSGKYASEIEKLMVDRSALVFKEMHLTDEEQRQFARTIGSITLQGDEGVSKISMDPNVSSVADYTRGAFYWHIDGASDPTPAKATMLTARKLADEGGDTLICNTYAAYDDLSEEDKTTLQGIKVRHALEASQRLIHNQPSVAQLSRWRTHPSQTHPLAWHHHSGRSSLLLGATCLYVDGMSREEGDMLLCRMQEWATQDEYVYRHKWTVGDFLLWDNTGTMHRADWYSLDSDRLMSRCTLDGEEPIH
jgi:alpha-ketoglutarate-dependent taurine dioxygenase